MNLRRTAPLRILCATDLSPASLQAFHHALALALTGPTELTLLHVGTASRDAVRWERFPGVRATLARWGRLAAAAPKTAVAEQLGIAVSKVAMRDQEPALGILDHLARHPADLVVLGTAPQAGSGWRWRQPVCIRVLRQARCNLLLLPRGSRSLLDEASGQPRLRRLLLALDHEPDARDAIARVGDWLLPLCPDRLHAVTLYVGSDDPPPYVLPRHECVAWERRQTVGAVSTTILTQATGLDADLVVMPSAGRNGWRDRLRGSTLEQVQRSLARPLLVIPEPEVRAVTDA